MPAFLTMTLAAVYKDRKNPFVVMSIKLWKFVLGLYPSSFY